MRRTRWQPALLALVLGLGGAGLALASSSERVSFWLSVRRLEADHRLQEAAWALLEHGQVRQAERMLGRLERTLAQGRVVRVRPLGRDTLSRVHRVDLAEGVSAVFKPEGATLRPGVDQAPRKEIAASKIDQLLGLGLVPLTVSRSVDGSSGSFQYFVRDVVTGSSLGMRGWNASRSLQFFDALLANWDRHAGNYLVDPSGRQIAIDHNLAFDEDRYRWPPDPIQLVPGRRVYLNLKRLTDARVRGALEGLLTESELAALLARKARLTRILDEVTDQGRRLEVFDGP